MQDSVERFTKAVQDYVKYRPSYPKEILDVLVSECGLTKDKIIADIGSGTGLLAKLFLEYGNTVYGIEPNQEMREAAEEYLREYPNFYTLNGVAEETKLESSSVDLVAAGTSFHWFDAEKAKVEFKRILRAPGWVLLVWNVRDIENSDLLRDYEELILKYGTDYCKSNASKFDKTVQETFFSPNEMKTRSFKNSQLLDWYGLKGRLLSTSYSLRSGDEKYDEMLKKLRHIFNKYQKNGVIDFLYQTKLYYGLMSVSH